jgi:hypothetical protein
MWELDICRCRASLVFGAFFARLASHVPPLGSSDNRGNCHGTFVGTRFLSWSRKALEHEKSEAKV